MTSGPGKLHADFDGVEGLTDQLEAGIRGSDTKLGGELNDSRLRRHQQYLQR